VIVSRETEEKLRAYERLLKKWQPAINLVSPKTLNDAWERHFLDSLQIAALIPAHCKVLFDFGSGAGFPGLVLAIARPDIDVTLIESDSKKCSFLSTVSRETKTPIRIINQRIEHFNTEIKPDIITARALAELVSLLEFSTCFAQSNPKLVLIFSKGQNVDSEIKVANQKFKFEYKKIKSETDPTASITLISSLSPLKA
jgi:16S rRNA (guanine527-N7)-methyltransferase